MSHTMDHEDDEPLLPLVSYSPKNSTQTPFEDIIKTSKLSGSTVSDSISLSTPTDAIDPHNQDRHQHHHHHRHGDHSNSHNHHHNHNYNNNNSILLQVNDDSAKRLSSSTDCDNSYRVSVSDDGFGDSEDDESMLIKVKKESERDKRRLKIAIGLCGTFFVVELLGGLWSESLALLSDSFHLLTDITSFVISLTAIYLSHRPSTATHTFGYHRAEVLGALFSIFLIWGLTFLLLVEAYDRIKHPIDVDGKTMSIVAGLGVTVNIILMFVLGGHHHHHGDDHGHDHGHGHGHGHGHSHGHSHGNDHGHGHGSSHAHHEHTPLQNTDDHDHDHDHENGSHSLTHKPTPHDHSGHDHHHHHMNLNITAATLHVLGDLLSSIGVLISSLTITFYPSLTFLDPGCTFIFSILVILTTIGVFKRSVSILMERVPNGLDSEEVKEAICDIPGVLEVKSLNIWSLTIGQVALAGSLYLQPEVKDLKRATAIVTKTRRMLKKRYRIKECTIQVELYTPHAESSNRHRHSEATTLSTASINEPKSFINGKSSSRVSMEALSRHDNDIIFSIGDDDLEELPGLTPTRSTGHGQTHLAPNQIIRAGTPLSLYRESHHSSEDESENEMEQEVPLKTETNRWA